MTLTPFELFIGFAMIFIGYVVIKRSVNQSPTLNKKSAHIKQFSKKRNINNQMYCYDTTLNDWVLLSTILEDYPNLTIADFENVPTISAGNASLGIISNQFEKQPSDCRYEKPVNDLIEPKYHSEPSRDTNRSSCYDTDSSSLSSSSSSFDSSSSSSCSGSSSSGGCD